MTELLVPMMLVERGDRVETSCERLLGVLVVDGALGLRTIAASGRTVEILPQGSVCDPAEENPASFVHASTVALVRTRLAPIDERVCRWPPIVAEIVSRLCHRARSTQAQKALDSQSGLERRVLCCL